MKICFDLTPLRTTSRFRGIGTYALGLAKAFIRSSHLLSGIDLYFLLDIHHYEPLTPSMTEEDIVAFFGPNSSRKVWPDSPYYLLKHTISQAVLSRGHFDLFHSTDPKGTPHPRKSKVVLTCHDLIPAILNYPFQPRLLPTRMRRHIEWMRYRQADQVIAISECTKGDLQKIARLPETRISVIHHGIDFDIFNQQAAADEATRVAKMLNSPRPYFLYMGGFDSRKQVPKMINAFALAARHIDEALVIGGNLKPAMRLIIEELIQQRGLNDRILLPGFVEQSWLPALYRQATAHLMFSRYEGFGMTITEAFACGCPVVALRASCIPEIAGDAALLVENNTLEEMAEAMQRIATEVNLQTELRQKGLERARHFTWERCAAQTIEVYRHLLAL